MLCSSPRENWVDKTVEIYYYKIKEKQMTKSQKEELDKMEKELRKELGETFGKDVEEAFDKLSEALHKEIKGLDEEEYADPDMKKVEELENEIKDFATKINKKIDTIKPELRKAGFGLIISSWSCGSPTIFMGAGSRKTVNKKLLPFIEKQLSEEE